MAATCWSLALGVRKSSRLFPLVVLDIRLEVVIVSNGYYSDSAEKRELFAKEIAVLSLHRSVTLAMEEAIKAFFKKKAVYK